MSKSTYLNDHWTLADGFGATAEQLARGLASAAAVHGSTYRQMGRGQNQRLAPRFCTLGGSPIAQAMPIGEPLSDNNANNH